MPEQQSKGGLPAWTVLVALFCILVGILGALGWMYNEWQNEKKRVQRQEEQLEILKRQNKVQKESATENSKLTTARTEQERAIAHIHSATNSLMNLLTAVRSVSAVAEELKTSNTGKKLAQDTTLVTRANFLYQEELPKVPEESEVVSRLENVRRAEGTVEAMWKTAGTPSQKLVANVIDQGIWAEQKNEDVEKVDRLFQSLISDAESKFIEEPITQATPTLLASIQRIQERQAEKRQERISQATAEARDIAAIKEAEVRADEIVTKALEKAKRIEMALEEQRNQLKRDAEKHRSDLQQALEEHRLQLKQKEAEHLDQLAQDAEAHTAELQRKEEEHYKELQRQKKEWEASQKLLDAEARSKATAVERSATTTELISKAKDPKVQNLLRPFLDDGLWQPASGNGTDFGPMSLGELRKVGALTQNQAGLNRLVRCGGDKRDKYRTRWTTRLWRRNIELIKKYKEAQQLLIELGPTMVEAGMLAP